MKMKVGQYLFNIAVAFVLGIMFAHNLHLWTTTSLNRNSASTTTSSSTPGATTREIINAAYITCPSGRIAEMRKKGVPIVSIGHRKYEGARAFEMYAIDIPKPAPKPPVNEQAKQLALSMTA
jgi:hypothetical protein